MSGVRLAPPQPPNPDSKVKGKGTAPVRPDLRLERLLWQQGLERVAGVDEAGRGAWAGPVVAAAVVLPRALEPLSQLLELPPGVRDSKALSPQQRADEAEIIRRLACDVAVGIVSQEVVDELGLACAGQLAFWRAVCALATPPEFLLVDGFPLWSPSYRQAAILQGDQHCVSVAAASIVAKVTRDEIMRALDVEAPEYGFGQNCGYGTPSHRRALHRFGPSRYHRRSYQPVAASVNSDDCDPGPDSGAEADLAEDQHA